ncbi:MAG: hypothetical protein ABW072_07970 [Sedimenticola sp.]
MRLEEEAEKITELLKGKTVKACVRNDECELLIIFEDGGRLFVNSSDELDFSITGC